MDKKKLTRLIAVCTACLSMGIFAFSGCSNKGNGDASTGGNTEIGNTTGGNTEGGNTEGGNTEGGNTEGGNTEGGNTEGGNTEGGNTEGGNTEGGNTEGGNTEGGTGKDPTKPGDPIVTPEKPEITEPVAGGPTITEYSEAELEEAYVEWTAATNAKWYSVYYSPKGANNWTKLDGPLVREYKDYYRADALGLKAGEYDMKIVPVDKDDKEVEQYAATAKGITVVAHDRSGYAFTSGNVPGAYKEDGTLKDGAQVFYVTAATAKTISTTVNKKGKPTEATGLQTIIDTRQDSGDLTPLCFRIVGTVKLSDLDHISSSAEGLQIKGAENITIEGVGNDGTINGFGMLIRSCKNVEVNNLGIVNFMDDGVSIDTDNSYLWMHNLDIFYGSAGGDKDQAKGDGSLDIKKSYYCTVSYNHFWDSGKCCLLDAQAGTGTSASNYMTYHHNWFDHSDSRHARVRNASAVHIYNNYFDGNSKYGVGGACGSSTFVESNYFRSTSNSTKAMMIAAQGTDALGDGTFSGEPGGIIKGYGNTFDMPSQPIPHTASATEFDYYAATARNETVPSSINTKKGNTTYSNFDTASDFYEYKVDTAEVAKQRVEMYAGRVQGGDLKWTFDNETEDRNYNIISELKSKVVGYNGSVLSIGGIAVTGGITGGNTGTGEGGGDGETTTNPPAAIDGEIVYLPQTDGTAKAGLTITGSIKTGKATATIDSVAISKTLEFDSSASIKFTAPADKDYELKLYLSVASINNNGKEAQSSEFKSESGYYVYTCTVSKGTAVTLTKKNTTQLFKLVLTPKA